MRPRSRAAGAGRSGTVRSALAPRPTASAAAGRATAASSSPLAWWPTCPAAPTADSAITTIATAMASTQASSSRFRVSRSTSLDSTSRITTPDPSTGCTTLTGASVSATTCSPKPQSISPNPASQAGAVSRMPRSRSACLASIAGSRASARFSRIRPRWYAVVASSATTRASSGRVMGAPPPDPRSGRATSCTARRTRRRRCRT